jgi:hypothetical protein
LNDACRSRCLAITDKVEKHKHIDTTSPKLLQGIPPGYTVDIGAEIVHGTGTVLDSIIVQEMAPLQQEQRDVKPPMLEHVLEPRYIAAHGDGGPEDEPTSDGKYGMYYMNGQLRSFFNNNNTTTQEKNEGFSTKGTSTVTANETFHVLTDILTKTLATDESYQPSRNVCYGSLERPLGSAKN